MQTGEEDVSQFDSKFTRQTPVDSPVDSMLSESADKIFQVKEINAVDLGQQRVCNTLQPFCLYTPHNLSIFHKTLLPFNFLIFPLSDSSVLRNCYSLFAH